MSLDKEAGYLWRISLPLPSPHPHSHSVLLSMPGSQRRSPHRRTWGLTWMGASTGKGLSGERSTSTTRGGAAWAAAGTPGTGSKARAEKWGFRRYWFHAATEDTEEVSQMPSSRRGQGLVLPPRSSSLEINLLHATCTSISISKGSHQSGERS